MNISEILLIEDIRRRNPGRLHPADMQRILERFDKMDKRISDALDALGAATDAELTKLSAIETQLRAGSVSNDDTAAIADRINAITARLQGSISDTVAAVSTPVTTSGDQGGDQSGGNTTVQSADQPGLVSGGSGLQPQS